MPAVGVHQAMEAAVQGVSDKDNHARQDADRGSDGQAVPDIVSLAMAFDSLLPLGTIHGIGEDNGDGCAVCQVGDVCAKPARLFGNEFLPYLGPCVIAVSPRIFDTFGRRQFAPREILVHVFFGAVAISGFLQGRRSVLLSDIHQDCSQSCHTQHEQDACPDDPFLFHCVFARSRALCCLSDGPKRKTSAPTIFDT